MLNKVVATRQGGPVVAHVGGHSPGHLHVPMCRTLEQVGFAFLLKESRLRNLTYLLCLCACALVNFRRTTRVRLHLVNEVLGTVHAVLSWHCHVSISTVAFSSSFAFL